MPRVSCPSCRHMFQYGEQHAGKKAKCRKCGEMFRLPTDTISTPSVTLKTDKSTAINAAPTGEASPSSASEKYTASRKYSDDGLGPMALRLMAMVPVAAIVVGIGYFFWWLGNRLHPGDPEAKAGVHTLCYVAALAIWGCGGTSLVTLITGLGAGGESYACPNCFGKLHAWLKPPAGESISCPHCNATIRG